jgi:hypothetical protein
VTQPRRRKSVAKRDVPSLMGTANVNVLGLWPATFSSQEPAPTRRKPRRAAAQRAEATPPSRLPVQAVVNRHLLLEPFTVDVRLQNPDTGVIEGIRRVPEAAGILGNWGAEVNDPARFASRVNPRRAICHILAPRAAARCLAGTAP